MTSFAYDGAGRLVATTVPTGQVTRAAYDGVGNRTSSTDAAGKTTIYTFNSVNRLIRERSPLGNVTETAYDAIGNVTSRTDPLNHTTTYTYDAADRMTATTDALNHTTAISYDNANRKTAQTDANNHTTSYAYDNDDRLTSGTAPDGGVTTLTYDDASNLTSRRDDNNHTTSFAYDDLNRLIAKTDTLNRTWSYEYDAVGNRRKVVDANGNATSGDPNDGTTTYAYDAADRQTSINYSDPTPDVSVSYDLTGRRTGMTDGAGTQSYVYDDADRLVSVIRGSQSFVYGYDAAGRLASRTYPDGTITSYGYDDGSRLATVTVGSNTTAYSYDAASRSTATALSNGWTEQRTYDNADRLTDIRSLNGTQTLAAAAYTRDNIGNPTTIIRDGVTETYSYDNADRITGACYGGQISTCPTGSLITYSYDKAGNRLTQNKFGTSTAYSYDAADQLTQTTSGGNTTSYGYDENGNQIGQGTRTFGYDLAGRLTQTQDGANTVSFSYDGLGNRLTKTAAASTISYLWDENNQLPMLALEKNGGNVLRVYNYGQQLISMKTAGNSRYFHHDALGTTAAITSATGATEWTYTYDPYGAARTTTKVDPVAPDNTNQYTGELLDAETGLYDLRARLYDPASGRFLSIDPLAQDIADPALSTYLYANAQPLVLTDPSGQRPDEGDGGTNPGTFTHPCPGGTGYWINNQSECPPPAPPPPGGGGAGGTAGGASSVPHPSNCSRHRDMCDDDGEVPVPDDPHAIANSEIAEAGAATPLCGQDLLSCQPEDFGAMSWDDRIRWLKAIEARYGLGGWMNVFIGTLQYFKTSPTFADSERMRAADGWVLFAISKGLAAAMGAGVPPGEGGPWERFFKVLRANPINPPVDTLKRLWGEAEQIGVNLSVEMTEHIRQSDEERFVFDVFKGLGDFYRGAVIDGTDIPGFAEDPRKDARNVLRLAKCAEKAAVSAYHSALGGIFNATRCGIGIIVSGL